MPGKTPLPPILKSSCWQWMCRVRALPGVKCCDAPRLPCSAGTDYLPLPFIPSTMEIKMARQNVDLFKPASPRCLTINIENLPNRSVLSPSPHSASQQSADTYISYRNVQEQRGNFIERLDFRSGKGKITKGTDWFGYWFSLLALWDFPSPDRDMSNSSPLVEIDTFFAPGSKSGLGWVLLAFTDVKTEHKAIF